MIFWIGKFRKINTKMKPTRHQDKLADKAKTSKNMFFQCFWRLGNAFLHPISIKIRWQMDAKISDQIDCLLGRFLDNFLMDFRPNLASKIDAKSIKNLFTNQFENWYDFGWIFGGSWVGFGGQVGSKIHQKNPTCKLDRFFDEFLGRGSHAGAAGRWGIPYNTSMHPSKEHPSGEL